jgi:hypothetical protein
MRRYFASLTPIFQAQESITKGQFVMEYVGEVITMSECQRRLAGAVRSGEKNYYYLTLENNWVCFVTRLCMQKLMHWYCR